MERKATASQRRREADAIQARARAQTERARNAAEARSALGDGGVALIYLLAVSHLSRIETDC